MDADKEKQVRALITELLEVPNEKRTEEIVEQVNRLSPDPEWSDYIFYSDDFYTEDETFDMDRYIAKLKEYKPIQL